MINFLKKIKKTVLYNFFITYLFYPIYHFLWKNIINFNARLLFIFLKDKNEFFSLGSNDKILIKDNIDFQKLASLIKNEALPMIPNQKKKLLSENYKLQVQSRNKAFGELPYSIDFYNELSDVLKSKIVKFASSKKMINTAANYMGIYPMITRIQVALNIPRENSNARSAMLWHKDAFGFKNLDFFMAVTDIDEDSGPFYCLEKRIKAGTFKNFPYVKSKSGERGKVSFDEFDRVFKGHSIIPLIGKSGTAFFLDSFSTYHRGGFCKAKDRLVLRICYQSHDVVHDSYIRNNEYFLFDKSIKKNEINDKTKRYLFFKQPSNTMKIFSKLLMKFFSVIEFKY